ncbi:hypothetical protein ABTM89_19985, partial [Acinetobacter baumannii]
HRPRLRRGTPGKPACTGLRPRLLRPLPVRLGLRPLRLLLPRLAPPQQQRWALVQRQVRLQPSLLRALHRRGPPVLQTWH